MANSKNYNNLSQVEPSLESKDYYCDETFEAELKNVWYRSWIYAGRESEIACQGDFKSLRIGSQNLLLVRNEHDQINGFHNTCRHRGSELCSEEQGNLKSKNISRPYHRWTYSLDGALIRTPHLIPTDDFRPEEYSLYPVSVKRWKGSLFVNLDESRLDSFDSSLDPSPNHLDNWPLEELVLVHSYEMKILCNWKIFWENFVECYHCPGTHKSLCDMVPIYRRTFVSKKDESGWEKHQDDADPKFSGGLKSGAKSWTTDGQLQGIQFSDLSANEIQAGYTYLQSLPSVFIAAHSDYVRTVSLLPDGPEAISLRVDWLLSKESLNLEQFDLSKIVDFGVEILKEDAEVCELNQRGVKSLSHKQGVLMPQEYDVVNFHTWLKSRFRAQ
jgi:Rieske 2Fe-2S family protein